MYRQMVVKQRIMPDPPNGWKSWEDLMKEALKEAYQARENNEVPVGAIIVSKDGHILGRGRNSPIQDSDPTAHAEIIALRQAAKACGNYRVNDAIMVVTLEPCFMCTGAMVHARLSGVVYGAYDEKAGSVCSCLEGLDLPLHNSQLWHMGGILEGQCGEILTDFFAYK